MLNMISSLPKEAGVYQYYDKNEKLLYVGKAKTLNQGLVRIFLKTKKILKQNYLLNRLKI